MQLNTCSFWLTEIKESKAAKKYSNRAEVKFRKNELVLGVRGLGFHSSWQSLWSKVLLHAGNIAIYLTRMLTEWTRRKQVALFGREGTLKAFFPPYFSVKAEKLLLKFEVFSLVCTFQSENKSLWRKSFPLLSGLVGINTSNEGVQGTIFNLSRKQLTETCTQKEVRWGKTGRRRSNTP